MTRRSTTPAARPPAHRRRSADAGLARRVPVRQAVVTAVLALALAALLDAEALQDTVNAQPFGWRHDVATAVAEPLVELSRALHLTAPRRWLEDALDRPPRPSDDEPAPTTTSPTSTSTEPSTTSTGPATTEPTTTTTEPARRRPSADAPLRLLVVGDSMTEAFGPALLDAADATGVVDAERELQYSSGLTRPDYFDWPAEIATLLAEQDPEAVVVMLGANDAQGIQTPAGPASFGSAAWVAEYRSRVAQLMDLLDRDERTVYWVGQPIMRSSDFDERMRLITDLYREEATRHPGVRFIASRELFSSDGAYSAYLPGSDGQPVLVRRDDGIHLTAAGGERLAGAVLEAIGRDWDLDGP